MSALYNLSGNANLRNLNVQASASINMGNNIVQFVNDPVAPKDAVNLQFLQNNPATLVAVALPDIAVPTVGAGQNVDPAAAGAWYKANGTSTTSTITFATGSLGAVSKRFLFGNGSSTANLVIDFTGSTYTILGLPTATSLTLLASGGNTNSTVEIALIAPTVVQIVSSSSVLIQ